MPYKTLTLVTSDSTLILQFLSTDSHDALSWDGAVREVWTDMFEKTSPFGRKYKFYEASKLCLVNAFSRSKTAINSNYDQLISAQANAFIGDQVQNDLYELVDGIVSRSLLQIFFGSSYSAQLLAAFDTLAASLRQNVSSKDKNKIENARLSFKAIVQQILQERVDDTEQFADGGDYLQWLITHTPSCPTDSIVTSPNASTVDFRTHYTNVSAAMPMQNSTMSSESSAAEEITAEEKQRRDSYVKKDVPDHLLATLLQTRLLSTVCVFWHIYSYFRTDNQIPPDPLLLVRRSRKEVLIGSTVIPKSTFVAISPVLERAIARHTAYLPTPHSPSRSLTELSSFSAIDSITDLSEAALPHDSPHRYPPPSHNNQQSTSSFSPLLRNQKHLSQVSSSLSDIKDSEPHATEAMFKSKKGSWVRHYAQGHLISLMVGSISSVICPRFTLSEPNTVKPVFGSARALWLPFPSSRVSLIPEGTVYTKLTQPNN